MDEREDLGDTRQTSQLRAAHHQGTLEREEIESNLEQIDSESELNCDVVFLLQLSVLLLQRPFFLSLGGQLFYKEQLKHLVAVEAPLM
jgi:hypothetical protein